MDTTQSPTELAAVPCSPLLERMKIASNIMAGLLASGHYSHLIRDGDEDEDEPRLKAWDAGKEYEEEGHERRFPRHVVDDTMSLLGDLEFRLLAEDSEVKANAELRDRSGSGTPTQNQPSKLP